MSKSPKDTLTPAGTKITGLSCALVEAAEHFDILEDGSPEHVESREILDAGYPTDAKGKVIYDDENEDQWVWDGESWVAPSGEGPFDFGLEFYASNPDNDLDPNIFFLVDGDLRHKGGKGNALNYKTPNNTVIVGSFSLSEAVRDPITVDTETGKLLSYYSSARLGTEKEIEDLEDRIVFEDENQKHWVWSVNAKAWRPPAGRYVVGYIDDRWWITPPEDVREEALTYLEDDEEKLKLFDRVPKDVLGDLAYQSCDDDSLYSLTVKLRGDVIDAALAWAKNNPHRLAEVDEIG